MSLNLLFHPEPLEFESLSNYFMRLAIKNYCKLDWLLKEFNINYSEINRINDINTIHKISSATSLSIEQIVNMTIQRFSEELISRSVLRNKYANLYFYTSKSSSFCPYCLDKTLYHRLHWSIESIRVCIEHKIYLLSKCQRCNKILTHIDISKGICICGQSLLTMESQKCSNKELNKIHKKILYAYGIYTASNHFKKVCDLDIKDVGLKLFIGRQNVQYLKNKKI